MTDSAGGKDKGETPRRSIRGINWCGKHIGIKSVGYYSLSSLVSATSVNSKGFLA
jgi:hypothetical protein